MGGEGSGPRDDREPEPGEIGFDEQGRPIIRMPDDPVAPIEQPAQVGRFDPSTYPGWRPDGPVVVRDDELVPISLDDAMLHDPAWRWSVGFGSNACPDRLVDKGLADRGAILLPCRVRGWRAAWEARRSPMTGSVPVTLVPSPGFVLAAWALGMHVDDAPAMDWSEGRGRRYHLTRVGAVVVAERWMLNPGLAYCAAEATVLLTDPADHGTPLWLDRHDQAAAVARLEARAPTVAAPRIDDVVPVDQWPVTPLTPIDRR